VRCVLQRAIGIQRICRHSGRPRPGRRRPLRTCTMFGQTGSGALSFDIRPAIWVPNSGSPGNRPSGSFLQPADRSVRFPLICPPRHSFCLKASPAVSALWAAGTPCPGPASRPYPA